MCQVLLLLSLLLLSRCSLSPFIKFELENDMGVEKNEIQGRAEKSGTNLDRN